MHTPPLASSILGGITRDSDHDPGARPRLLRVQRNRRCRARRSYIADEVFVVGTAAEVTPIRSIDRITVGSGRRGPVTEALQRAFFDVINGEVPARHGWLDLRRIRRRRRCDRAAQALSPAAARGQRARQRPPENRRRERRLRPAPEGRQLPDDAPCAARCMPATDEKRLDHDDVVAMSAAVMSTTQRQKFKETQEVDLAYSVPGLGRFRCNIFQQRGTVGMVLRVIPMQIRSIDGTRPAAGAARRSPMRNAASCWSPARPAAARATTLAAMIDHINQTLPAHVMTVEDPIEFLHRDHKSIINQREVGGRHAIVRAGAAQRAAPGSRRHPGRRDARLRDDRNRRCSRRRPATSCSRRCTRSTPPRRSTASSPSSRRTSRSRSACSWPACCRAVDLAASDAAASTARGRAPAVEVMISTAVHPRLHRRQGQDAPHPRRDRRGHVACTACRPSISRSSACSSRVSSRYDEALRWASNVDEFKLQVQGIATTSDMSREDMARTVLSPPEITRFGSASPDFRPLRGVRLQPTFAIIPPHYMPLDAGTRLGA